MMRCQPPWQCYYIRSRAGDLCAWCRNPPQAQRGEVVITLLIVIALALASAGIIAETAATPRSIPPISETERHYP